MEYLTQLPILFLIAAFHGVAMKIADLTDEHDLHWFKGDKILFGILWGTFGALFIFSGNILASFYIAMMIHWVLRYRIDYLNHGLAATIVFVAFIYTLPSFEINWLIFLVTLVGYSLHGLLNDSADRGEIKGFWARYFESNSHYFTLPIILGFINPAYWIILMVSAVHLIAYETTKKIAQKHGYT